MKLNDWELDRLHDDIRNLPRWRYQYSSVEAARAAALAYREIALKLVEHVKSLPIKKKRS